MGAPWIYRKCNGFIRRSIRAAWKNRKSNGFIGEVLQHLVLHLDSVMVYRSLETS